MSGQLSGNMRLLGSTDILHIEVVTPEEGYDPRNSADAQKVMPTPTGWVRFPMCPRSMAFARSRLFPYAYANPGRTWP